MLSEDQIADFLRLQYQLWNEQKREELNAAFKAVAPNRLVIEYIGSPPLDGWRALDEMWELYGGKVRTDVAHLVVNGNEAAVYVRNVRLLEKDAHSVGSIETYRFQDGDLFIRYYHATSST